MNMVITMGGIGSRFRKAGYTIPKYEIEVRGKTLFDWSLLSLKEFWREKFFFVVRKDDNAKEFIYSHCKEIDINPIIIEIDYITRGQAETAVIAKDYWDEKDDLFIYNIDTYVEPGYMKPDFIQGDGFIPCFSAIGNHWSFVKLGDDGSAIEVREKEKISNNCSIGAYYFSSVTLYLEVYKKFYIDGKILEKGECYIAPMYNYMIDHGYDVRIQSIPKERVHVLGTPDELEFFKNNTY